MEISITFAEVTCGATGCNQIFAVPLAVRTRWENTHELWYCPSGHHQHYGHKSEAEKLRDQLATTTARLDRERACCREKTARLAELGETLVKTRAGYRGQLAKQKRTQAGGGKG